MSDSLSINGFSAYAGFNGSVASVVTKAEIGLTSIARPPQRIAEFLRPDVPNDFPESSRINRNANQLRILNNLEGQFKRIQGDRDVAGQTLNQFLLKK